MLNTSRKRRGPYQKKTIEDAPIPEICCDTVASTPAYSVVEIDSYNDMEAKRKRHPHIAAEETAPVSLIRTTESTHDIKASNTSNQDSDDNSIDTIELQEDNVVMLEDKECPLFNINQREFDFQYTSSFCEDHASDADSLLENIQDELLQTNDTDFADEEEVIVTSDPIAEVVEDEVLETENETTESTKDDCDSPLFPGSTRRVGLTILLFCCLSIRFKWSDECLGYVISAFGLFLPSGHKMIRSIYALKDHLKKFVSFPKIHHLCSSCGTHTLKNVKTCANQHCLKDLTLPGAVGYFIQHSVIDQLQLMCKRKSSLETIRCHKFKHYAANSENNICDIYDGSIYKRLFDNGFLSDPNTISFSLNTDGVPVFKSSKMSMWPVYMLINELPISERKLKQNVVYYGLWICTKKPVMWSYLKPLHEELCKLEDGVQMEDSSGNCFTLAAILLNCVCDLPARCMLSNSMQFNGKYGCWFCLQPGETYRTNKGGHVHIFPYQNCDPKGPERSAANLQQDLNEVVENIQANKKDFIVRGIKGPFWFMLLKHFSVIHGFVIDYMHGICSGVMKMMLTLWFDQQNKNEVFSIFRYKSTVNSRLESIKPNIHITRPPRTLDDLCHWKSAEFRNFLFLWSIPVLHDILPQDYYYHFCLFVRGIYSISRETITVDELMNAECCLFKFVEMFPSFYSSRYLTMNCHQLVHICDSVRANGPLFANNCFVFEDLNGYILKYIHGPTGAEMQIINAIMKMQALPTLQEIYVEKNSDDEDLINAIMKPNFIHDKLCLEDRVFLLGQTYHKTLDADEFQAASDKGCASVIVKEFRKLFMMKLFAAVYGTAYHRLLKRNQSIIKFTDSANEDIQFGSVKTFIQVETVTNTAINLALVHVFPLIGSYSHQQSAHKVNDESTAILAVPLTNILKVCNIVNVEGCTYISEFPNRYEKD